MFRYTSKQHLLEVAKPEHSLTRLNKTVCVIEDEIDYSGFKLVVHILIRGSLAEYEQHRARLMRDSLAKENYAFSQKQKFILKESRIFLKIASPPIS